MNSTSPVTPLPYATLPDLFCWSKICSYSGQAAKVILGRKEHERLYRQKEVWWGIGEDLRTRIIKRLCRDSLSLAPPVILTSQPTDYQQKDSSVWVWQDYVIGKSPPQPIPKHALVLPWGTTKEGAERTDYFALVFQCDTPLTTDPQECLDPCAVWNASDRNRDVKRQVTAVVQRKPTVVPSGDYRYRIHIQGRLVSPFCVKLTNPRQWPLDAEERDAAEEAGKRILPEKDWMELVRSIREAKGRRRRSK